MIKLLGGDEAASKIIYGSDSADQGNEDEKEDASRQSATGEFHASSQGSRGKCDHHGADEGSPPGSASEREKELDSFMRENKRAWVPIPATPERSSGDNRGRSGGDGDIASEKRET